MTAPLGIADHHRRVRATPCVVTGRPDVTLHHCHGGSVSERLAAMGLDTVKPMGRRGYGEALVIPLVLEYHSLDGKGIDANLGVRRWESLYGTQAEHLDALSDLLGYSLWELHRKWSHQVLPKTFSRKRFSGT